MKRNEWSWRQLRDLPVRARSAILEALDALDAHLSAVVVIGAQTIYLRANAPVAVAEVTKDGDIALDLRRLDDDRSRVRVPLSPELVLSSSVRNG